MGVVAERETSFLFSHLAYETIGIHEEQLLLHYTKWLNAYSLNY